MAVTKTIQINTGEIQALKQRISDAQAYDLSLSKEDNQHILDALVTLEHLQQQLHTDSITLHKLRKLLGIEISSEKLSALCKKGKTTDGSQTNHVKPPRKRKLKPPQTPPLTVHHLSSRRGMP